MFWAGFGIFAAATLCFVSMGLSMKGEFAAILRITPFMSAAITLTSAITYLVFATDHGYFAVCGDQRPMYYARYVDWLITTPLMLVLLGQVGAIANDNICFIVFLDIAMIMCGFIGSFVDTGAKWAFLAFGILAMLPIFFVLGNAHANWQRLGLASAPGAKAFSSAIGILVITWSLYALLWILTDGTHSMCRNVEAILYLGLDIVAKIVFLLVLNSWSRSTGGNAQLIPSNPVGTSSFI